MFQLPQLNTCPSVLVSPIILADVFHHNSTPLLLPSLLDNCSRHGSLWQLLPKIRSDLDLDKVLTESLDLCVPTQQAKGRRKIDSVVRGHAHEA